MAGRPALAGERHEVILLSNGFQPEYEIGFANGLARNGMEPLLVCSDELPPGRFEPGVALINLRGSQDPRRHSLAKAVNIIRYWVATMRLLRRQKPRVVHLIGLFTLRSTVAGLVEIVVLRLVSQRLALTVHNLLPHDAHGVVNRFVYRLIYRLPDTLVVHTRRMRDDLQRDFDVPSDRIVVMEHGIDRIVPPLAGKRDWLRHQCSLDPSRPIVLFFGNVVPYKGLDLLVQAFGTLAADTDAVLVIAGRCRDEALRLELRTQLTPLLTARRAFWFDGFVPEEHVLHYFHGADLLAMPYRHIDQSALVFMALATGLPVLAADVGSLREYVPLTDGCLVPPADAAALGSAIEHMSAGLRGRNRDRVLRRARRFLWERTVRPLLPVYGHTA